MRAPARLGSQRDSPKGLRSFRARRARGGHSVHAYGDGDAGITVGIYAIFIVFVS